MHSSTRHAEIDFVHRVLPIGNGTVNSQIFENFLFLAKLFSCPVSRLIGRTLRVIAFVDQSKPEAIGEPFFW